MGSQQLLLHRPLPGARLNMAHPLARYLVLCMTFNEQGSRAMDLSPSGAHGRLYGFGSPAKRHIGGLDFVAATPSYVEIPASFTQLDFISEDFSVVARIKIDSLADTRTIVKRASSDNDGYSFDITPTGRLRATTYQMFASQFSRSDVEAIVIGTEYTVGLSRSGASIRLSIDGVDVTTSPVVHDDPVSNAGDFLIGINRDLTTDPFDGKIEFLRVFRGISLSEAEHKAIYENPYAPYGYPLFL